MPDKGQSGHSALQKLRSGSPNCAVGLGQPGQYGILPQHVANHDLVT
jgi:hypothetical protein